MEFEGTDLETRPGDGQPGDIVIDLIVVGLLVYCCLVSWVSFPSVAKKTVWNFFRKPKEGTSEVELSLQGEAPDYLELASTNHKSEPAPKNASKSGGGVDYFLQAVYFLTATVYLFGFYNCKLISDWMDDALKRSWASAVTSSAVTPFVPVLCLVPCFLMHTHGLAKSISTKVVDFINSFGNKCSYDTGMVFIGTLSYLITSIVSLYVLKYFPVSGVTAAVILAMTALSSAGEAFVEPALFELAARAGPSYVDATVIGTGFSGIVLALASAFVIHRQHAEPADLLASRQECIIKSSLPDVRVRDLLKKWSDQIFTRGDEPDTWISSRLSNIISSDSEDNNSIKKKMSKFLDYFEIKARRSPEFESFDLFYLPDIDITHQNAVTMVLAVTLIGTIFIPLLYRKLKQGTSTASASIDELPSEEKSHNDDVDDDDDEVKAIWADVWPVLMSQSLTYVITGATYPSFMIKMVRSGDPNADSWFITVMLVRSATDAGFKFLAGYLISKRVSCIVNISPRSQFWLAIFRIPFFAALLVIPFDIPVAAEHKRTLALVLMGIITSSGAMLSAMNCRTPSAIVHNNQRLPEKLKISVMKAIQQSYFVVFYLGWVIGNCVGQLLSRLYTSAGLFDN